LNKQLNKQEREMADLAKFILSPSPHNVPPFWKQCQLLPKAEQPKQKTPNDSDVCSKIPNISFRELEKEAKELGKKAKQMNSINNK